MLTTLERQLRQRPGRAWAVLDDQDGTPARAAVAAVIRPQGDLLFIRRSEREGDPWSGHMAFPGGRFDPADASLLRAAQREVREEVGLDLAETGHFLGALDELHSPVHAGPTRLVISPFVYSLATNPLLRPNEEVASVHWISLARLVAGDGRASFELEWQGQRWLMPSIDLDGVRIWGLTLRMVDDIMQRIGGVVSPPVRARSS
ncbi:MAG: CoA pyrophosphatase [Oligoflexia bacterium]|nr:CoA pyrophosphatase [Oligoflexia bacterium]